MTFDRARHVADAVLYEGYVLYPYRASARKNQVRWQFGVAAPQQWSEAGGCESWWMGTECLLEADEVLRLIGRVRFLQLQRRTIEAQSREGSRFHVVESLEVGGRLWMTWDEAVEREVDFDHSVVMAELEDGERTVAFAFPEGEEVEPIRDDDGNVVGRCVRKRWPIAGTVRIVLTAADESLLKLSVRVENVTPWPDTAAPRDEALRCAFLGLHTLLGAEGGSFISLLDPPAWATAEVARCVNVRTWPVLIGDAGDRDVVLSSPIILYDYPQIAPESPGDLFDATEIDEILTLRTLTLTDEEQREARATDQRAAAIIDRVNMMPPEVFDRLHGAIRHLRLVTGVKSATPAPPVRDNTELAPWWDPGADASVSPDTDSIEVSGVTLAKGSRVRLRPGARRADAQDMFLAGRTATVTGVFFDVEDHSYLAVTLDDDPAADLYQSHGRYLYFAADEVEPLEGSR